MKILKYCSVAMAVYLILPGCSIVEKAGFPIPIGGPDEVRPDIHSFDTFQWCSTTKAEVAGDDADLEQQTMSLTKQNERVVRCMRSSILRVARAQSDFAEALGAKDQAEKLRFESEHLRKSNYSDMSVLEKHIVVSKETNRVIREKIQQKQNLTSESRVTFSEGLLDYAVAMRETKEMGDALVPYYKAVEYRLSQLRNQYLLEKDLSPIERFKLLGSMLSLGKAMLGEEFAMTSYLAVNGGDLIDDHFEALRSVTHYARDNRIKVPKDLSVLAGDIV